MKDEDKLEERILPDSFREIHVTNLNYGVLIRSTYDHEDLDFMISRYLGILAKLKENEKE